MENIELKALKQAIEELCDEETEQKLMRRQQILQKIYEENIVYPIISFGNNKIILNRFIHQKDIKGLGFKRDKDKGYWYREYDSDVIRKNRINI